MSHHLSVTSLLFPTHLISVRSDHYQQLATHLASQ